MKSCEWDNNSNGGAGDGAGEKFSLNGGFLIRFNDDT